MNKPVITAIIPARGGSKGILHKNIHSFNGRPLICWMIEAALNSELIDNIYVSTDDNSIAQIADQAGAQIIKRPPSLSTDTATSETAIIHALESLEVLPDITVFLQCTSPLTLSTDIDRCIQKLINTDVDCSFTATESHQFLWKNATQAEGVNHKSNIRLRRQDLEPEYAENGAAYAMMTTRFLKERTRFFGKISISEMPHTRSWEIDSPDDITIAETLQRLSPKKKHTIPLVQAVIFDFDGVMTDNMVYLSEDGTESVRCNRGDGWGIGKLLRSDIKVVVMSSEKNTVVQARCKKLGVECYLGLGHDKLTCFQAWLKSNRIAPKLVAFVGNDENDIPCLKLAGTAVIPSDAHQSVEPFANIILKAEGGKGAVREICDIILNNNNND